MTTRAFPAKMVKSLLWAKWNMKDAAAACAHMGMMTDMSAELTRAMLTGIVVCYARPFMASQGVSRLSKQFEEFATKRQTVLHNSLIEARNQIYAHNDRNTSPKWMRGLTSDQLATVSVQIDNRGNVVWRAPQHGLASEHADEIAQLCAFQAHRFNIEALRIVRQFSDEKWYKPGAYTLGVDFP